MWIIGTQSSSGHDNDFKQECPKGFNLLQDRIVVICYHESVSIHWHYSFWDFENRQMHQSEKIHLNFFPFDDQKVTKVTYHFIYGDWGSLECALCITSFMLKIHFSNIHDFKTMRFDHFMWLFRLVCACFLFFLSLLMLSLGCLCDKGMFFFVHFRILHRKSLTAKSTRSGMMAQ